MGWNHELDGKLITDWNIHRTHAEKLVLSPTHLEDYEDTKAPGARDKVVVFGSLCEKRVFGFVGIC